MVNSAFVYSVKLTFRYKEPSTLTAVEALANLCIFDIY